MTHVDFFSLRFKLPKDRLPIFWKEMMGITHIIDFYQFHHRSRQGANTAVETEKNAMKNPDTDFRCSLCTTWYSASE